MMSYPKRTAWIKKRKQEVFQVGSFWRLKFSEMAKSSPKKHPIQCFKILEVEDGKCSVIDLCNKSKTKSLSKKQILSDFEKISKEIADKIVDANLQKTPKSVSPRQRN